MRNKHTGLVAIVLLVYSALLVWEELPWLSGFYVLLMFLVVVAFGRGDPK